MAQEDMQHPSGEKPGSDKNENVDVNGTSAYKVSEEKDLESFQIKQAFEPLESRTGKASQNVQESDKGLPPDPHE